MPTMTPTTLSIDQPLLQRVQKAYGFKTKKETVNAALEKMARKKALDDLFALAGKIDWDEEGHKAQEHYAQQKREKLYESLDW